MKNRRKRTGGNVTVMADISRRSILSIIKQLGEKNPPEGRRRVRSQEPETPFFI
jgi:hypothetical protein